jgi:hypothetical protein
MHTGACRTEFLVCSFRTIRFAAALEMPLWWCIYLQDQIQSASVIEVLALCWSCNSVLLCSHAFSLNWFLKHLECDLDVIQERNIAFNRIVRFRQFLQLHKSYIYIYKRKARRRWRGGVNRNVPNTCRTDIAIYKSKSHMKRTLFLFTRKIKITC